jgi:hypothetical protein
VGDIINLKKTGHGRFSFGFVIVVAPVPPGASHLGLGTSPSVALRLAIPWVCWLEVLVLRVGVAMHAALLYSISPTSLSSSDHSAMNLWRATGSLTRWWSGLSLLLLHWLLTARLFSMCHLMMLGGPLLYVLRHG